MTNIKEIAQKAACDALDAGKPVQDMADAVTVAVLTYLAEHRLRDLASAPVSLLSELVRCEARHASGDRCKFDHGHLGLHITYGLQSWAVAPPAQTADPREHPYRMGYRAGFHR